MRFFNTSSGQIEEFSPYNPERVTMYVCGPTVYDRIHLGNARPLVVFDLLARLLKRNYRQVDYIRNITDVDDKIIERAEAEGVCPKKWAGEMTTLFDKDSSALSCLAPDAEPKATEHIESMISFIERLLKIGSAYRTSDGHVLFKIRKFSDYGRFARLSQAELIDGFRVKPLSCRKEKGDFVLWKPAEGALSWDSPWGRGRPGWHLECSAMCRRYLGGEIDIHGGGQDLIFPHHQNEIAQSRSAYPDESFVKMWIHNGYVTCEGKKMSKSLGNFHRVCDLLKKFSGAALRLTLLRTHYRHPLDFSETRVEESEKNLSKLRSLSREEGILASHSTDSSLDQQHLIFDKFVEILEEDLNTPRALAYLFTRAEQIPYLRGSERLQAMEGLREALSLLGLSEREKVVSAQEITWIQERIALRDEARRERDFVLADKIRSDLEQQGIVLEDSAEKTHWHRK